MTIEDKQLYTA